MKRKLLAIALACSSSAVLAQTTIFGSLSNFDAVNNTGGKTYGFEIELDGINPADIAYTFGGSYERYGDPTISATATGSVVRYASSYDPVAGKFTVWTDPASAAFPATGGHSCWSGGGSGYPNIPCDHFGLSTSQAPTATRYHWLVADPATAGNLITGQGVTLPAPIWSVVQPPAPAPGAPLPAPVVHANIQPPPEKDPSQFGDAYWVKIFTTEVEKGVKLEELVRNNPLVADARTEVEWEFVQYDPGNPNDPLFDNVNEARPGVEAVIRRYEVYAYTGPYKDEDHEALCKDRLACMGDYVGSQMAGINLAPVPEPETYAMFLSGLGILGMISRRRRDRR